MDEEKGKINGKLWKPICLLLYVIVFPGRILAQKNSDSLQIKSYELGNIVVTAGRTPVETYKSTRIVTIITKDEIEAAPARDLNDLLRFIVGVDIRQRGPLGTQADLTIRGGTYDQTLILLNGINVTDPQTGHHNLNLPVDIESIERIEILEGSAAKSFGPNAFNGAINIITGNNKINHLRSSISWGQYGLFKASANISNTIGRLEHFISISKTSSDGYISNTDFAKTSIFYQAKYNNKAGTIDFQTGADLKDFGANSFYSLKYPGQYEATRTQFLSLKYQSNTPIKIASAFYLRRNRDRFELKRNNDSIPFNHHLTNTSGLNLNVSKIHRAGKTSIGIDFRYENIMSNVLGNIKNIPVRVPGYENTFYSKYYGRMNTSIYGEHLVSLDKLSVNIGFMAHHNSDLKRFRIYPGIDISYQLNDVLKVFSSANKTLRMPTFTDMFYKSPVQNGNPALIPEEALSVEGGIKYTKSCLTGYVSVFRRNGYDLIDWVKDPSPDSIIWRSMNHSRINFSGFESSLSLSPPVESIFGRIRSFRVSYSFLQAGADHDKILSKYAYDYLKHQIIVSMDFRVTWKLFNSIRLTYHDRNGVYPDAMGQTTSYRPYWLSDTKLYWKNPNYTLYFEASNIFNSGYFDFGGIIQPGVWLSGGIILDLNYAKQK